MAITIQCPECQLSLKVESDQGGKKGKCPRCRSIVHVPLSAKNKSNNSYSPHLLLWPWLIAGTATILLVIALWNSMTSQATVRDLQASLEESAQQLQVEREEIEKQRRWLRSYKSTVEDQQQRLGSAEQRIRELETTEAGMRNRAVESDRNLVKAKSETAALESEIKKIGAEKRQLEQQAKEAVATINGLKDDLKRKTEDDLGRKDLSTPSPAAGQKPDGVLTYRLLNIVNPDGSTRSLPPGMKDTYVVPVRPQDRDKNPR